jgi:glycosyltransferase involved in cell wall biosynthesis
MAPSICNGTFGLTVLESLQHGAPGIASGFGALPEVLADTEGGVVYRDIPDLESLLQKFDSDSEYTRALGLSGQARTHKYGPEAHLREYIRIVEEELSGR